MWLSPLKSISYLLFFNFFKLSFKLATLNSLYSDVAVYFFSNSSLSNAATSASAVGLVLRVVDRYEDYSDEARY